MNWKSFLVLLVFIFFINNFVYSDAQEEKLPDKQTIPFTINKNIDENPKINPKIFSAIDSGNLLRSASPNTSEDKIKVYIYLKPEQMDSFQKNFEVLAQSENIISARLTIDQINSISEFPEVLKIDLPIYGEVDGHAVSEGVSFSFADDMQAAGFTGNGIKVAVIDAGFITSNSEISSNVFFESPCSTHTTVACINPDGNSHGTAVAEIVVDMAPNVDLYLYATGGMDLGDIDQVDVENAILDAISKDVDIITMSLGFSSIGGDGTTGFQKDGTSSMSKKVNQARDNGILFIKSAGNDGNKHWKGTYNAITPAALGITSSHESFMNFRPSETGLQKICLPVFDVNEGYFLNWSDWSSIPNSNQNYNVFLFDPTFSTQLGESQGSQNGFQFPKEAMQINFFIAPQLACVVIASFSSTENHLFHLKTRNPIDPAESVSAGSISIPGDATGALTVGAIRAANPNSVLVDELELFSSQGPTDDGRNKPEICGPDNTFSHQTSKSPFLGTSGAAPHVAGAAALLLEKYPSLTVDELKSLLIEIARFNSSYSVNNLCGGNSGALDLSRVPGPPPPSTDVIAPIGTGLPGCETTSSCFLPFQHVINQGEQVTWYNDDVVAHAVTSGNPVDGPDGIFDSSLLLSGGSFSHTFMTAGTFDYFDIVHPWATGQVQVNGPCLPPPSGNWVIQSNCTMPSSPSNPAIINGDLIVEMNSVLTIPAGVSLDIDFSMHKITVESGSGILIQAGGSIT